MSTWDPRANKIFLSALERVTERQAYLDGACGDDTELRRAVDDMLEAQEAAGSFLCHPAHPTLTIAGSESASTMVMPALDPESSGMRLGRYVLRHKLGEGGFGVVWLAEQTEPLHRRVAIKIIKAGMENSSILARFEQERQALALMNHPNIARVLDAGKVGVASSEWRLSSEHSEGKDAPVTGLRAFRAGATQGPRGSSAPATYRPSSATDSSPTTRHSSLTTRSYFVMELVEGVSFTQHCNQARLTVRERLELFIPVCQAVQHAHQKGIIHRDLKPSNVLVALYDGKPVPKVIDFGIAKATGSKLTDRTFSTEAGQLIGTLEYMSPEQADFGNIDIDTRADIYSLGVMLYELLTGRPPFAASSGHGLDTMLRLVREVEPPIPSARLANEPDREFIAAQRRLDPRKLSQQVRGDLDWVVMKCLAKERGRRYESASSLARDLARLLANEPVTAGPPSVGYRLRKFVCRHRGPVLAASIVFVTLIVGTIGTALGLVQAREERRAAVEFAARANSAQLAESRALQMARKRLAQIEKVNEILSSIFRNLDTLETDREDASLAKRIADRLDQAAALLHGLLIHFWPGYNAYQAFPREKIVPDRNVRFISR
jgi:eukaryotic-like serine/threonine-protein kinase